MSFWRLNVLSGVLRYPPCSPIRSRYCGTTSRRQSPICSRMSVLFPPNPPGRTWPSCPRRKKSKTITATMTMPRMVNPLTCPLLMLGKIDLIASPLFMYLPPSDLYKYCASFLHIESHPFQDIVKGISALHIIHRCFLCKCMESSVLPKDNSFIKLK